MQLADLKPAQLVGFGGAHGRLYDAIQDVPIKLSRPVLTFDFDIFGDEPIRQFG